MGCCSIKKIAYYFGEFNYLIIFAISFKINDYEKTRNPQPRNHATTQSRNHFFELYQYFGVIFFLLLTSNSFSQNSCGSSLSNPFTQTGRCMSETDGDMEYSFQDRIEAVNAALGMPAGSNAAGQKKKFRSLFVSGRINGSDVVCAKYKCFIT